MMKPMNPIRRIRRKLGRRTSAPTSLFEPSDTHLQMGAEHLLQEMVSVDSLTTDPLGVNRVQAIIARELQAMGFTCETRPNPSAVSGDFLIGTFEGKSKGLFITFVSHADVVMGLDTVGSYRKSADALRAQGPGVIDNKGGVTVALRGLQHYLTRLKAEGRQPEFSLRFISSPNEEAGSPGFQDLLATFAHDSSIVLGFEPALDDGSIIESRRGNRWYQVMIKGQEAHAGRCKGEELNAAHDAGIKMGKLQKLTDVKNGLSVNVGQIKGGRDRFNIVCGEIEMKLDARFSSFQAREKLHRQIEAILLTPSVRSPITGLATETRYSIEDDCPPFAATAASRSLLKAYLKRVKDLEGRSIRAVKAGGAGDVNYISAEGVIVLDGLGPIGGNMHTPDEFIHLASLSTRAMSLSTFLARIDERSTRLMTSSSVRDDLKLKFKPTSPPRL